MGIGDTIKSKVDAARELLGADGLLNGSTDIGKCSIEELSTARIKDTFGPDYSDELDAGWAMIEVSAGFGVKSGDYITLTATGHKYIVRRVTCTQAAGVKLAERCLCILAMVSE